MHLSARDSELSSTTIHRAVDASLNSIILEGFVCGMYTILFGYTLSRLVRTPNKKIYALTLFILWALVITTFAFDWMFQRSVLVVNDSSPLSIIEAINNDNSRIRYLEDIFSALSTLVADDILIWRCFTLWEAKRWALIPLPAALIASIIIGSLVFFVPADVIVDEYPAAFNNLVIAFFLLSVGITAVGTFLIILRITLVTQRSPISTHRRAYRRVQAIVLESGILYSIAILVTAITLLIQARASLAAQINARVITGYPEALLTPLSGIGPTLIAARVGAEVKENKPDATRSLSHLTFKRTTRRNNTSGFGEQSSIPESHPHLQSSHSPKQQSADSYIANNGGIDGMV